MTPPRLAVLAVLGIGAGGCARESAQGRPWIHDVTFAGVNHAKPRQLKRRLQLEETSWIPLAPKKYLDPFTLELDRQRIEAFYRARGYFSARVVSADAIPRKDGKSVDVKITVEEGDPTHIGELRIDGLDNLGKRGEALERSVRSKLKSGAILVHADYLAARDEPEHRLKSRGFAWAHTEGQVEVNRDSRNAAVHLGVRPGPRAVFGRIRVHGNQRTDARDLAARSRIREGTRFDPEDLEDARTALYDLGMFSMVNVEVERSPERADVADVLITVRESKFNDLRVGLGLGLESLRSDAHAALLYTRRNFRGKLRQLRLRLEPAWVAIPAFWNLQRTGPAIIAEAHLLQPDVVCPGTEVKLVLGYDVGIEYPFQYHGPRTSTGVGRTFWHDRLFLALSYNFQYLDFFNTDPAFTQDPAQAGRLLGYVDPYRVGWLQQDINLDLRDRKLDPHKGAYFGLLVEEAGAYTGSAFLYEKLQPDARGYVPLGGRVTLAARAQYGYTFVHGDLGSPTTRRFYLGGPNSHRGFSFNRLSPQVPSGVAGVAPLPIGGDLMFLGQVELRVDVVEVAKNWLAFAAFFDAGDVPDPGRALDFTNLHLAAGGGLRLKTAIGNIRFDLGVRLNRLSPTEADGTSNPDPGQRFAFHVSVGEAF